MTDNKLDNREIDKTVRDGLRALGLSDGGETLPALVPNLPPETPPEHPQHILVTSIGSNSR